MAEENDPKGSLAGPLNDLPPDQAERIVKLTTDKVVERFASWLDELLPSALDKALLEFGYNKDIAGLVQLLAARSNDSKEGVLQKALDLYALALDAREKGNRMAILSPDDVILHEVVGFEPAELAGHQTTWAR